MSRTGTQIEERRETLRAWPSPQVNGIDRVEVDPLARDKLTIRLIHPAPGQAGGVPGGSAALTEDDLTLTGGDRIRGLRVLAVQSNGHDLTLTLNLAGDFSVYHIRIDHPGFDPILREAAFGFRADCPEIFDPCETPEGGVDNTDIALPPEIGPPNYLGRDYAGFRQLMLDRIAALSSDDTEREIPDIGLTLVELMAHYGDLLSYRQDVVATESYIGTARLRPSLARHAALLGYTLSDGLSARVFIHLNASTTHSFTPDTIRFATPHPKLPDTVANLSAEQVFEMAEQGMQVFEPVPITFGPTPPDALSTALPPPVATITISDAQNAMPIHDWGDDRAILPRGATRCWVEADAARVSLRAGDYLILQQQRHPETGRTADADRAKRQVVQLVSDPQPDADPLPNGGGTPIPLVRLDWHAVDALRFDLAVGRPASGDLAVALGNVVLCDHGASSGATSETLGPVPPRIDPDRPGAISSLSDLDIHPAFRPSLSRRDLSIVRPLHRGPTLRGAGHVMTGGGATPVPAITLQDSDGQSWKPVDSLLNVSDTTRAFVVETEADGRSHLRFAAADSFGLQVEPGQTFTPRYRVGRGPSGNIGAETIAHVFAPVGFPVISAVNPLPAFGGELPESDMHIRINAPNAAIRNKRAVIAQDYIDRMRTHEDVVQAHVRKVWHGSWNTLVIAVDLVGGQALTPELRDALEAHIEPYRLMGQDVRVETPVFAPIDLALHVCIAPGHHEADVLESVREALSAGRTRDGRYGLFHPDRLGFGEPVYLSRIYEAAYRVVGVADVRVVRFSRWDRPEEDYLEDGVFRAPTGEIPVLMNDPNYPERGRLQVLPWMTAVEANA